MGRSCGARRRMPALRFLRREGPGALHLPRGGSGICVRPHRYAWARWLTVSLGLDELGLHERDMPLCVKVCGMDRPRQHASVRSARSQAAVRNAAPIRGEGPIRLSQYQPTKFTLVQLRVTVRRTRGRFGLSAGYQSHSLELRHFNSHNISRGRCGTRRSHLSARGCAWVRGPSRDLSMRNGPTKTFDVAHQFHLSRLT